MIQKEQLSIGDWVTTRKWREKPFQLTRINEDNKFFYGKNGDIYFGPFLIEELEPVPITLEILEKNGFKNDKNDTYSKRYFFACNLNKVPQTVVEFSFYGKGISADTLFRCWTKPESCDGENSIHICDLKSVHELQHALRLCGIKHEITL